MSYCRSLSLTAVLAGILAFAQSAHAQILPEAEIGIKIALVDKPTSRPMTVAYVPAFQRYYIADGGLGPVPGDMDHPFSRSLIHVYSADGKFLQSVEPGINNRSLYYNPIQNRLETASYNISSEAGFAPNTGIFALKLSESGDLKEDFDEISGVNPAFGDAATMPTYDAVNKRYFAKQERSNKVLIVEPPKREKSSEITLDLAAADVGSDGVSDHYVAYTGIPGEELALLDIDHKVILVYGLDGKLVGKSALPKSMKLRAENHYNGLGYANGMFFVYHQPEGEFGTYYGFRFSDAATVSK